MWNEGFGFDGFIGLGPGPDETTSYVANLFNQQVILKKIVGLNYQPYGSENPSHVFVTLPKPKIHFGFIDEGQVKGGSKSMAEFTNIGSTSWTL